MRRRLAAALLLLTVVLAGCGGGDDPTVAASDPASETETAAPTEVSEPPVASEPPAAPTDEADDATEPAPVETPAEPDAAPAPAPAPTDDPHSGHDTQTFELSLNGDGVEGGCSWGVDEDEFFYEIRYPAGFSVVGSPVTLVDGAGNVLVSEGEGMRVTGHLAPDETPSCDVGTVLVADSVEPL